MQVKLDKTSGVIRWDAQDWLAGLVPHFQNSSIYGVIALSDGVSWVRAMTPFRIPGVLAPGVKPTNVTNASAITGLQKNGVTSGSKAYTVGGVQVNEIDLTNNTVTTPTTFPYTVTHGGHSAVDLNDVCVYYIGTTKYVFYSFNDATDGDVGRYNLTTTFADNFMSATAASGAVLNKNYPHPMVVGDDDCLYIGNGNVLARFDGQTGANGTFTASALQLPLGFIITSFAKLSNYLVIYGYRSSAVSNTYYKSEAFAFHWDYVSEDPTYKFALQGNYVNGGFNYKNTVGCFIRGQDTYSTYSKSSKLLIFNGSAYEPIFAFNENIPGHGGVEVGDDLIQFNADGAIYNWGTPHIGFKKIINRVAQGIGTTPEGMLKNFSGSTLLASSGTGINGGMEVLSTNYDGSAALTCTQALPNFPAGYKGRVTKVLLDWYSLATTGHKANAKIVYDNSYATLFDHNSVAAKGTLEEFNYLSSGAALPNFQQLGFALGYTEATATNADLLRAVEIHFDYTKI